MWRRWGAATGRCPRRPCHRRRGGGAGRGGGGESAGRGGLLVGGEGRASRRRGGLLVGGEVGDGGGGGESAGGEAEALVDLGILPPNRPVENLSSPSSLPCARQTAHGKEYALSAHCLVGPACGLCRVHAHGKEVSSLPCACTRQRPIKFSFLL